MGALVFVSLLAAIPACIFAALFWVRAARSVPGAEQSVILARAALWTGLALACQAVSLIATALAVAR